MNPDVGFVLTAIQRAPRWQDWAPATLARLPLAPTLLPDDVTTAEVELRLDRLVDQEWEMLYRTVALATELAHDSIARSDRVAARTSADVVTVLHARFPVAQLAALVAEVTAAVEATNERYRAEILPARRAEQERREALVRAREEAQRQLTAQARVLDPPVDRP